MLVPSSPRRAPLWTASFPRPVTGLGFSPDGKTLAVCTGEPGVRLYDAASGKLLRELEGPAGCFNVTWSGGRLFLRGYGGLIQYEGERVVLKVPGPLAAGAASGDGQVVLTGDNLVDRGGRCEDYFLDLYRNGTKEWTHHGEDRCVDMLQLPPAGDRYLVQWRNRRTIQGWSLSTGGWLGLGSCRFSPTGDLLAFRERESQTLTLRDGQKGKVVAGPVPAPPFSTVTYGAERVLCSGKGVVQAYDGRTAQEQARLTFGGEEWLTSEFADGRMVVSYTPSGRWLKWDAGTGKIHLQPVDSVAKVNSVAVSAGRAAFGGEQELKVFGL